ncbi:MAG: cold shock domain-containing protein [Inhella sp.]
MVLLIGDGDFVPLVRKLAGLGTRVMLLGWDFQLRARGRRYRTQVSGALPDKVHYPVMMDKVIDARERRADPLVNNLFLRARPTCRRATRRCPAPAPAEVEDALERLGVLVNWFPDKGYGFIRLVLGGDNLFFHVSELQDCAADQLYLQCSLSYLLARGDRGPVAKQVRPLGEDAPPL